MRKFFRGGRRKVGVLTLALAMLLIFWWVRSLFITDVLCVRERNQFLEAYLFDIITFFSSDRVNVFASDGSSMLWLRRKDRNLNEPLYSRYEASGDVLEHMIPQSDVSNPVVIYVPYPAIVIPLILISLWLLLAKPRQSNAQKTEPSCGNDAQQGPQMISRSGSAVM